jgi:hypothetical protein
MFHPLLKQQFETVYQRGGILKLMGEKQKSVKVIAIRDVHRVAYNERKEKENQEDAYCQWQNQTSIHSEDFCDEKSHRPEQFWPVCAEMK